MEEINKYIGVVVCVYPDECFGFLRCEDLEENTYFHKYALLNQSIENVRIGDKAEFIVISNNSDRTQAGHVTILNTNEGRL